MRDDDDDTPLPVHAISDAGDGPPTARVIADKAAREILSLLPLAPMTQGELDYAHRMVGARIRRLQRKTTQDFRSAADRQYIELRERTEEVENRVGALSARYKAVLEDNEDLRRRLSRANEEVHRLRADLARARNAMRREP